MKKKLLIILPIIVVTAIGYFVYTQSGFGVDIKNPPKFIQADFIDLSKIYSISKYRSGAGHDFSGNGETCRSMKHYYSPQYTGEGSKDANGLPPKPDGKTDISIFSPVDGTIVEVSEEHTPIGKQVTIVPSSASGYQIRLFHIYLDNTHNAGTKVKAGEKIAVIGGQQGTDIAVQAGGILSQKFISYFDVMPDSLFSNYTARGATSRADFILTKEYRDAHPLKCGDGSKSDKASEMFVYPDGYDHNQDEFHLSGYTEPKYDMQNNNQPGPTN